MKLLALDTSSLACSVALQSGDAVSCRHEEQAREHTRLLVPMIDAAGNITVADTGSLNTNAVTVTTDASAQTVDLAAADWTIGGDVFARSCAAR